MTDDTTRETVPKLDRRTLLTATAGLAGATALPFGVGSAAGATGDRLDDAFDLTSDTLQEALVVFDSNAAVSRLDTLDLAEGYLAFDVLPVGYTLLTGSQLQTVADWDAVRYVERNRDLDYHNADARDVTGVDTVRNDSGYDGSSVHVAVVDSGLDGDHPDLIEAAEHNYQWAGNPLGDPTLWVDGGTLVDTDDIGHGTHCSGTIAGDGSVNGEDSGMAPGAALTVYSSGAAVSILKAAAAYDHILANHVADVDIVSNSYGAASADDYNPDGTLQTATWTAFDSGLLPVISAGNSGPDYDTLNDYAKAPHVLSVAATTDQKAITDFSSRARAASTGANYDRQTALANLEEYYDSGSSSGPVGLYRNGVAAPGNQVNSTMSPADALQATAPDNSLYYAAISGTSMSCPVTAGIAALVIDAHRQNGHGDPDPMAVLNTVEATAYEARSDYNPANAGAGFVDAEAAVSRAESGDLATFADVTLTEP
ncbi:S8 family serine peptidase [Haloarchaeobius sp. HME9146]|uniref:S8 family serine peptidase n=1 Tax=Haloarchaeobius sp. HME9146 TaxID=2978732 RepID=UPI0021C18EA0|nr:S8 family serine peptidase [Haloarchaeobius sp. HME9146]MCT9095477.1 S8 family serine peptidase [Haloarchaeobius sp. HME9146]